MTEYKSMDAMRNMIDAWKADAKRLQEKAANAHDDAQHDVEQEAKDLERRRENIEARLEEMRGDAGDAWTEMKNGVSKASSELGDAISRASARMR